MKKLVCRILAAASLAVLNACGGGDNAPPPVVVPPTPVPVAHTLSFDTNSATGAAPIPITALAGQAIQLPSADLTVAGYTFAGWNTQADGRGATYLPAASLAMPNANLVLYAQFKAPPIKLTQQGGDAESRLLVEWPDGSTQDIVYTARIVGWGNSYDFNPVVGGMAILVPGGTRYIHTNYPDDYHANGQPVMTIASGGSTLLKASTFRLSDREGPLAAVGSSVTADEIRVTVTGRILDADADTEVELILRSDAPRMALTRSKITYARPTNVTRLYHQLVHANPNRLFDPITYLSARDGSMIETATLPENLMGGIFYTTQPSYHVGFVGPRTGAKDFLAYRDGPYFAAYKIIYDNALKQAGDLTESRGVAAWGFSIDEARRLLGWSIDYTRGGAPATTGMPYAHRGALRMVSESYGL